MSNTKKTEKGVSIYFVFIIMTIFLAIGLGLSAILIGQLKTIKGMEDSVISFYAADTGVEEVLMERGGPGAILGALSNDASYQVTVLNPGPGCSAPNFCIKSIGNYRGTKRAIEINY